MAAYLKVIVYLLVVFFFRGDSSPFPAEIAAEEQVRGGVVQVVLLLHRLAVARLHRLLRQVRL